MSVNPVFGINNMEAILNSNSGKESIVIDFASFPENPQYGADAILILRGMNWDGDHEYPMHIRSEGIVIDIAQLRKFVTGLRNWVSLPLNKIAHKKLTGNFSLAGISGQKLDICFEDCDDIISNSKPVVVVRFKLGKLMGEFYFVTDQSCIKIFLDNINSFMKNAEPASSQDADKL